MAENPPPAKRKLPIPPLPATAYTSKKGKQKQTEEQKKVKKREADRPRDKTRVNIGIAFLRWRELRDLKGFKTDAELATFLFDSYEKDPSTSTPRKQRPLRLPPPPVSTIASEFLSGRDDEISEAGFQELGKSISEETALQQFDARDDCFLNLGQYKAGFAKHLKIKPGSVPTVSGSTTDVEAASTSSASFQFPASRDVACQTDPLETHTVGTLLSLSTQKPHIRSAAPVKKPSKRSRLNLEEEVKQEDDPLQTSSSVAASKGLDSTYDPADSVATLTESTSLS